MKDEITSELADKALAPVRALRKKRPGLLKELSVAMTARTKTVWHLSKLSDWLNDDPAKRRQPTFGAGLLLLEIVREITKQNGKRN